MSSDDAASRVLVLTPTGRDAELTCDILGEHRITAETCRDVDELCIEILRGVGCVVIAEEALEPKRLGGLRGILDTQEPWSDLPFVVFARTDGTSRVVLDVLGPMANITILERPVRIATLVASVRSALRARVRQTQVGELLGRLAEADRRKDEFMAMLGHELRNPLSAIKTAHELLRDTDRGTDDAERLHAVIDRQTRHLARMLDDLLEVSRITRGKITLQCTRIDLVELIEEHVRNLRASERGLRREVSVELPDAPVLVDGDAVRLDQIVANLLENALKYTREGGRITVRLRSVDGRAVLWVSDDGVGIDRTMLHSIFDMFVQVDSSLDRSAGGLGLGLALVRGLVELHGGTIEARSDGVGRGSEFVVTLPLALSQASIAVTADGGGAPPAGEPPSLDVLIVEDNADGREMLQMVLTGWGHRVVAAANGVDGLALAVARPPAVAIVDIGLPGMDGYELARRLRRELGDRCTLIALTGYGRPEDRVRALAAGFDAHLVKPVSVQRLEDLLRAIG